MRNEVIYQFVKVLFAFLLPARLVSILVPRRRLFPLRQQRAMVPVTYHNHHIHLSAEAAVHISHSVLFGSSVNHNQQNVVHEYAEHDRIEQYPDTVREEIVSPN